MIEKFEFQAYRRRLTERIGRVALFGQEEARPLEKVFVELSLFDRVQQGNSKRAALELMDRELRDRRDPYARRYGSLDEYFVASARVFRPDTLLRNPRPSLIVGAPGCGKTTLMRHLCLASFARGERFPVYIEFKSLSDTDFENADGDLARLCLEQGVRKAIADDARLEQTLPLLFGEAWRLGRVTVFLDGLDEIKGRSFFRRAVELIERVPAGNDNAVFVSTRPYALDFEWNGARQYEIAPLATTQILDFLFHYFGGQPVAQEMAAAFRARPELRDFANTPFLLSVLAHLWRTSGPIGPDRLELYRKIVNELVVRLDREKGVVRFRVADPNGAEKRRVLTALAFEKLFRENVETDTERFVLSRDDIAAAVADHPAAEAFLDDVIATPLLKVIGPDLYAFCHLTVQEYLAATVLVAQSEPERALLRGLFNPFLVETEVLPMALGLLPTPDTVYAELETLPDNWSHANIRLRARGLAYVGRLDDARLRQVFLAYRSLFLEGNEGHYRFSEIVRRSFLSATASFRERLVEWLVPLFETPDENRRRSLIQAFQLFATDRPVPILAGALWDASDRVAVEAAWALGSIGSEAAVGALVAAIGDTANRDSRRNLAEIIGRTNSEAAIGPIQLLLDSPEEIIRERAVAALGKMRLERAVTLLVSRLSDPDPMVRGRAAVVLGTAGHVSAIPALLGLLAGDPDAEVCSRAAGALGDIGDPSALDGLTEALKDLNSIVRAKAVTAIGHLGLPHTVERLRPMLNDPAAFVVRRAREALAGLLAEAGKARFEAGLESDDEAFRLVVVEALTRVEAAWAVPLLRQCLFDPSAAVVAVARKALGLKNENSDDDALGKILLELHPDPEVRRDAFRRLLERGPSIDPPMLIALACDSEEDIRREADALLKRIPEKELFRHARAFLEELPARLGYRKDDVRQKWRIAIAQLMKRYLGVSTVVALIREGHTPAYDEFVSSTFRTCACPELLDVFREKLLESEGMERGAWLDLIAAVGTPAAFAVLERAFLEFEASEALLAGRALKDKAGPRGRAFLIRWFDSDDPRRKALAAVSLADDSVPGLSEFVLRDFFLSSELWERFSKKPDMGNEIDDFDGEGECDWWEDESFDERWDTFALGQAGRPILPPA